MRRHNQQRRDLPFMLLMQLAYQISQLSFIPPITIALIGLQWFVHLGTPPHLLGRSCMQGRDMLRLLQNSYTAEFAERALGATLTHADDYHIYYNSASFLAKGVRLEERHGSVRFAVLTVLLTVLTNILYPFVCLAADTLLGGGYSAQCAVGFSGVIFAVKTLMHWDDPHGSHAIPGLGLTVPTRYAAWAELIIIQLFNPRSSFVGHLSGILAALLYIFLRQTARATAPQLVRAIESLLPRRLPTFDGVNMRDFGLDGAQAWATGTGTGRGRTYGSGTWGGGSSGQTTHAQR